MEEIRPAIDKLKGGEYQVLAILGAGGFGITYRCIHVATGWTCAIKEYMPEAIASRDSYGRIVPDEDRMRAYLHGKKRFLEEAEMLMKMAHIPSVVHVRESFEENNTAYYVMEFLEGKTLKQVMRAMGGKLPYTVACEAVIKAGNALDAIHRQAGIFHRDISPENIMVLPNGEIKIIDFGSAKLMSVSENQQFSVVLKPGFAPPEQYASNLSQGSFTDVYALAGTFYYSASGKMIPVAPDRLMGASVERLDRLVPECSAETACAVERALNLDQKFRTQTMSEFIYEIQKGMAGMQTVGSNTVDTRIVDNGTTAGGTVTGHMEDVVTARPGDGGVQFAQPEAWFEVVVGACAGMTFPVTPNVPVTVGRSSKKSQYVLTGHPEVSGLHFQLMYAPQKSAFYVIDESVNGLYYKGYRLEKGKKYKVLPGDQIGIGSMQCVITVGVR